jgi:large subunit ribosomal protein L25
MDIKLYTRTDFGKKSAEKLRKSGLISVSLYFKGKPSVHAGTELKLFQKMMENPSIKTAHLNVLLDDKPFTKGLIKNVSFDPVKDVPRDIEIISLEGKDKLEVEVPIKLLGTSQCDGIKKGGKLNILKYNVSLECSPDNIPSYVEIDITDLKIGYNLKLSDITLPNGVSFKKDRVVLGVLGKRKKDEEEAAAA